MKVYTNNQKYKIGKVVYKLETSITIETMEDVCSQ